MGWFFKKGDVPHPWKHCEIGSILVKSKLNSPC
jgi:hypothetical protein